MTVGGSNFKEAAANSEALLPIDGKVLEQTMANATTPIFYCPPNANKSVIGTGFFYRNESKTFEIRTPSKINLDQLHPFFQWVFEQVKKIWNLVADYFPFWIRKQVESVVNLETEPIDFSKSLYLVTTKSIFKKIGTHCPSDQFFLSFNYRTKSSEHFTAKFRLCDLVRNEDCDLAAIDVGQLLSSQLTTDDEKLRLNDIASLRPAHIRDDSYLGEHFGVAERVTLFGYLFHFCSDGERQWLEEDAIARSGFTAFPPSKRFHGNDEGVVSMINYSGFDCGAPLLMRRNNTGQNGDQQEACFLGILRQWHSVDQLTGNNSQQNQPNSPPRLVLGKYVKAGLLKGIGEWA